jgi:hypothetical protein
MSLDEVEKISVSRPYQKALSRQSIGTLKTNHQAAASSRREETMLQDMRDKACIAGLGQTNQGKLPDMRRGRNCYMGLQTGA